MFYGTEIGNRLVNEDNYPDSIINYLEQENRMLQSHMKGHDILIEVGCMEARNMETAIKNGKKYIGIDIVPEYINIASEIAQKRNLQDMCEFLCIDAEKLDDILKKSSLIKKSQSPLFFFPFNSFGNMSDYESVLESVSRIKNADFLIYSYKTDELSTQERTKYYKNCNYDNLKIFQQKEGIRFVSDNGLSSIAYNEDFLSKAIKQLGLNLKVNPFGKIGIEYSIDTYEREIEK